MARALEADFEFDNLRQAHLYRQSRQDEFDKVCYFMRQLIKEFDAQYGHTKPPARLRIRERGLLRWRTQAPKPSMQRDIDIFGPPGVLDALPAPARDNFLHYEQRRMDLNMLHSILFAEMRHVDSWIDQTRKINSAREKANAQPGLNVTRQQCP